MRHEEPTRSQLLELDFDLRMLPLWERIWGDASIDDEQVAPLIHDAYARGYYHALAERQRGALYRAFKWPVPRRGELRDAEGGADQP